MKTWLAVAFEKQILTTALQVAVVIGSILVVINYGDRIINASLSTGDYYKIAITYTVPYFVATYSAVKTRLS